MDSKLFLKGVALGLSALLFWAASGCHSSNPNLKLHPIFGAALTGIAVGYVIGHQSNEDGEGAVLGASVFALGAFLSQLDNLTKEKEEASFTVWVPNPDGSFTPVLIQKKKNAYIGPQSEFYDRKPTPEILKERYAKDTIKNRP